ncbi:uncharacterized protein LOC122574103 isoform X2 [Bombus pyrosoma]|uniref:uncharacterized protein LOC122574103 isoform X2 n=1 Tax=Bombus pyrosoma TaxID=396416 RepID=UPI001CB92DEE|nr:uncharacterized protein LOC122574103 isoform X2 [Bombus pyrosoma]
MEYRAYRAINSDKRIPSGRRALNVRERIVCQRTMLTMVATLLLLLAYVCHVRLRNNYRIENDSLPPPEPKTTKRFFFWSNLEEKQGCQNEKVTTRGAKTRLAIEGWYVQEGQVLVDTDVRGGCRLIVKTAFRFQSEALCPERALSSRHRQLDNAESYNVAVLQLRRLMVGSRRSRSSASRETLWDRKRTSWGPDTNIRGWRVVLSLGLKLPSSRTTRGRRTKLF